MATDMRDVLSAIHCHPRRRQSRRPWIGYGFQSLMAKIGRKLGFGVTEGGTGPDGATCSL